MKTNEQARSIIHLNHYCLETILEYLTLEDHISFAETCSYFRLVFICWASYFYKNIILLSDISHGKLKMFAIVFENVQKLTIDVDDLIDSLAINYAGKSKYYFNQFCSLIICMPQLQSLILYQYKKKPYAQRILKSAKNSTQLKELHISDQKIFKTALKPFDKLELLSLDVQLSSKALQTTCQSMANLRALHLTKRVGTARLKNIIKGCPDLKELSFHVKPQQKVRSCTNNPEKIFGALSAKTINLTSLNVRGIISDIKQAEQIASIYSLRVLSCSFSNPHCVQFLVQLRLLEELRIKLVHIAVDMSETYLKLIRACTQLRLLSISDVNIKQDFAIKTSKVLAEFENRRPLKLFIHGHRNSTIVRTSKYIDESHLIYTPMNAQELLKLL